MATVSKVPEFVTYAGTTSQVERAVKSGVDHLILEDPKVSVRAYLDDQRQFGFDHIRSLIETAKSFREDIKLSFNIDMLAHHRHFPLIEEAIKAVSGFGIKHYRIQDPGLMSLISEIQPEAIFHLATETSNNNSAAWQSYNEVPHLERLVLTNELTADDIKSLSGSFSGQREFQVHGPILLQYSDRRLMAGYSVKGGVDEPDADSLEALPAKIAKDYKGKEFVFYDNPHGHFMYNSWDKCLLPSFQTLIELELDAWLFDGRGESIDYLDLAIETYKKSLHLYIEAGQVPGQSDIDSLREVSPRPFKIGFFKMNNTDRFDRDYLEERENTQWTGKCLDVIREKWMTVELFEDLRLNDVLRIETPEGRRKILTVKTMEDLEGKSIEEASEGDLVKLKWLGGVVSQSLLIKEVT